MIKRYTLITVALALTTVANGQNLSSLTAQVASNYSGEAETRPISVLRGSEPALWHDDFSDPSTWSFNNNGQSAPFGWSITSTATGWWSNGINSSSGGNFAELANGDPSATPGTQVINVTYSLTTAQPIDVQSLAGTGNVLLSFEQFGARFNDAQTVEVSTDGSAFTQVYSNVGFPMLTNMGGAAYPNPNLQIVDLGPYISGNASSVWIRFTWTSAFPGETNPNAWVTYGWYIDDVRILSKDAHNMVLDYGYISHNLTGAEYGRVPKAQLQPEILLGSSVRNFGYEAQNNVNLNVRVLNTQQQELYNDNATLTNLPAGDTAFLELLAESSLFENLGRYTVEFESWSDDDTTGTPTYSDNTKARRFEITDTLYSLDGLGGVHITSAALESIGNNSFSTTIADNFMGLVFYDIANAVNAKGIQVLLAPGTVKDATFFVSLFRAEDVEAETTQGLPDLYLTQSEVFDVAVNITNQNMNGSNGSPRIYFDAPETLEPGGYYAAVRTVGDKVIRLRDDITVPQPNGASVIFLPDDQNVYTNSNALGIRLILDANPIGINETSTLSHAVNVFPNPANGSNIFVDVDADKADRLTLNLYSTQGSLVMTQNLVISAGFNRESMEIDGLSNGLYFVQVVGTDGQSTTRLVVNR